MGRKLAVAKQLAGRARWRGVGFQMMKNNVNVQLDWCACIDEQTRINFAQTILQDIQKHYALDTPLNLVSLGSGALKQEELIVRLLLKAGYTHITLNLIDPLYTSYTPTSLAELEQQVTLFESTPDFEKLGDLYVELEGLDDPAAIKKIEQAIDQLEQKIKIEEYIALCNQQKTLLHQERLALLQALLPEVAIYCFVTTKEFLQKNPEKCDILIYCDPESREKYSSLQKNDFYVLKKISTKTYVLDTHKVLEK